MNIMQTRKMKKQLMEDTVVDSIEKLVLGRFEDPAECAQYQDAINNATTDLSKRQILLALMEKDGTQTEKDMKILGDIKRMMKTFDPYGAGFSLAKDHLAPLVEHLREYVKVGEVEKKEHGEVMTPIWLVEDMLDKLPEHVWSDPSLKWLDPCNGCGVFPSIVVSRLMDGLQNAIPDQVERYRHIVENMIHVCDIQAKNCFLHMVAFDPKDLFDMNVYCGSFLDQGFDKIAKDVWGVEKFDVIIGNPPYQSASTNRGRGHNLWNRFVKKSLSICQESGFFSMVHPAGWREARGTFKDVQKALLSLEMLYLELHNVSDGQKTFGASTSYDWYVVKNSPNNNCETTIKFQDGSLQKVKLENTQFIPNARMDEINKLIASSGEERVRLYDDRSAYGADKKHVSKVKDGTFINPVVYTCPARGGINFRWSSHRKNGHYGIQKVFWSNGASPVYVDWKGEYALTQFAYAISDEEGVLEKIKEALESERFIELMHACKLGQTHRYNPKIIALFRKDFWKEFIDD